MLIWELAPLIKADKAFVSQGPKYWQTYYAVEFMEHSNTRKVRRYFWMLDKANAHCFMISGGTDYGVASSYTGTLIPKLHQPWEMALANM